MKPLFRVLGGPLFVGLLLLISLSPNAGATSINAPRSDGLPMSPLSSGVLMAQAFHAGQAHFSGRAASTSVNPELNCKPAPCVLPNVRASEGGQNVDETPIAANPTNGKQLLTGGNDYNCGSIQGFFTTSNGGKTWTHTCMNTLPGDSGAGDPGVGYDLKGNAYITGIDQGSGGWVIAFEKSKNNGKNWSKPAVAVTPVFSNGLTDKEWLQVDDNPSSPHANTLYISVTQFDSSAQNTKISVSRSSDGGKTWKTAIVDSQTFPSIDQFSDLAIGKDGTVYASWMRCPGNGPQGNCTDTKSLILSSKSTDGGATWSTPAIVAHITLAGGTCGYYGCIPNSGARLSCVPPVDVDNSSGPNAGHLYTVFYNNTGTFLQVEVSTSTDGGATWGAPVPVTSGKLSWDQFYPWLTVSSNGTVGVTWLDRRNDKSNVNYETFAALSSDGATFGTNIQIASKPSNPNAGFMGDYTGNYWAGKKLYASWMDSSSGVFQDEVGGYRNS